MGGKGSWWSQVSHRKLKISIWVASILGDTAKDALLKSHNFKIQAQENNKVLLFEEIIG